VAATAALDQENEKIVLKNILQVMEGKTVLMIGKQYGYLYFKTEGEATHSSPQHCLQ